MLMMGAWPRWNRGRCWGRGLGWSRGGLRIPSRIEGVSGSLLPRSGRAFCLDRGMASDWLVREGERVGL